MPRPVLRRPGLRPIVRHDSGAHGGNMQIRDGFVGTVGNTPLIKLRRASEMTGCTILGKAEFLNPGGSVKDRAALAIITDAEERGLLRPGGVIVEGPPAIPGSVWHWSATLAATAR